METLQKQRVGACVEKIDPQDPRWESFLNQHDSVIFHTADWLQMMERSYRLKPAIYAWVTEGQIVSALTGFLFDWVLGKNYFAGIYEGGFAGKLESMNDLLRNAMPVLKRDRITKVRMMRSYFTPFDEPDGCQKIEASQHILNLESLSEEKLWKELYWHRLRKAIRKTEREKVLTVPIDSRERAEIMFSLNQELIGRRKTFSSFNKQMLYELYEKFLSKGKGAGWLAVKDGVYIAGLVTVYSPHVSHALLGGSKEEYLQVPANDLLLHNAILDAMRKGKRFFDFMCSSSDKQLRFYKEKFGTFEYPACFFEMDVDAFRAKIWDILWKIAHSKAGGKVARLITR